MSVDLAGLALRGVSIGGVETSLEVPAWALAFDLGRGPEAAASAATVLFTHAHADHMGGVVQHCALRALRRQPPPTYVVPREDEAAFRDLFAVWRRLDRSELEHALVPVGPGEELALGGGRGARAFRSPHRAPCQGYVVFRDVPKLRPELAGEPSERIAARKARGEPVSVVQRVDELAFTGDTRIDVLEREPALYGVRRLILEVTFLDERVSVAQARAMGHVHLDEVIERAGRFRNEALCFTHFSARYGAGEVRSILDRRLPPELRARVTPLLAGLRP